MKKILLGSLVIFFALTLSACGNKNQNQGEEKGQVQNQEQKKEDGGIISSIADAMKLGKKMECVYTNNINGKEVKATTWVDGKNFKSSSEIDGRVMYSLLKDEVMYSWGEGIPMASKLALDCVKDLNKNLPEAQQDQKNKEMANPEESFQNAANVSCKPVASVDLSVPADIKFEDQCEMMKGVTQNLKDIKIPAGVNVPNIPQ